MNNQIVIIGGGIIGMMTARALHQLGMTPILLDQGKLGQESSWAGGGIISPLHPWRFPDEVSLLAQYGQQNYQAYCDDLTEETGISPEWTKSGLLIPSYDELDTAVTWAKRFSSNLQLVDEKSELQSIEPKISSTFKQGLWMPDVAQVRNPRIVKSLKASLIKRQIDMREDTQAIDVKQNKNNEVCGVISKTGDNTNSIDCAKVIVAGGAWSGQFAALQKTALNVKPVLGEMILFKCKPNQLKRIILHNGRYLIPRQDGRIVCGSTLEFSGFDKRTKEESKQELRQAAIQLAPFLKDATIEHHWCGLRPGSPNGIPYIGEHPEIKNLYVNAGHYRNGVVIGLGSVQLLVDSISTSQSFVDIKRFGLDIARQPTSEFQT